MAVWRTEGHTDRQRAIESIMVYTMHVSRRAVKPICPRNT